MIPCRTRDETGRHQSTLVYGEITFSSFGIIFEKVGYLPPPPPWDWITCLLLTPHSLTGMLSLQIRNDYGKPNVGASGSKGYLQEPGGIFYDVGSGTGKPVSSGTVLDYFMYNTRVLTVRYPLSLVNVAGFLCSCVAPIQEGLWCRGMYGIFRHGPSLGLGGQAMTQPLFAVTVNWQILEGLYNTSVEILNKWNSNAKPLLKKFQEEETGELSLR